MSQHQQLCVNCKHYKAGTREECDTCTHPKAFKGGVRAPAYHKCASMIAGICSANSLFEPATLPQLIEGAIEK